jgi:hypothetical protein
MESFRQFCETKDFVEFAEASFDSPPSVPKPSHSKTWSAGKDEIMQTWQNLHPDLPIYIQPMSDNKTGVERSSFGEDGIRITGSWPFIASVLSRLKGMLNFENDNTKLRLVFRGVDKDHLTSPQKQSFVFYIHLQNRGGKDGFGV